MAKARQPLGCGMRKFGILLTVMVAAIIALPNTVTNDVVVATSDAELRISDRGLGLGLEVVGGGAAEVKLEARPGWRFRDGRTAVTLNKAAGEPAKSPDAVGEGQNSEGSATVVIVDGGDDDDENGDGEGSVEHEKPILSMTATAPKVVAYSVQDGGTNVSISLSATVTTNGKHRKLDAEGNVVEEKEFSPKHYVWKMTGVATGEAETDSSTHTFTVNLTKGESKSLNFSVVGKTCSICDGEVESDAATDSVEIDVYELSISRPDYLGLDRTDAGRQGHVVKTATLSSDPSLPSSSSVEWTECGICEFVGTRDQLTVSYQNNDSETASGEYLAERLAASVTLAGMDSSVVCATNFTVVKVDIELSDIVEKDDETALPPVEFVADNADGSLSKTGLRSLYQMKIKCEPYDVPGSVDLQFSSGIRLFEITSFDGDKPVSAVPAQSSYPCGEIGQKKFGIHGLSASVLEVGELIVARHALSGALDYARVKVVPPPPLEVSVRLDSPAEGGGWPYDPVWDDPDWRLTVDGSKAEQSAGDVDMATVIYTLSRDAKLVITDIYKSCLFPFSDEEVAWIPHCSPTEGVHTNVWGMVPSLDEGKYYAKVTATEAETWEPRSADSNKGEVIRKDYYVSSASDNMVMKEYIITDDETEALKYALGESGMAISVATIFVGWPEALLTGLGVGTWQLTSIPSWFKGGTIVSNVSWSVERFSWKENTYVIPPSYTTSGGAEIPTALNVYASTFNMDYVKIVNNTGNDVENLVTFYSQEYTTYGTLPSFQFDGFSCVQYDSCNNWKWEPIPSAGYGLKCPQCCE